jgi:outer membrane protein assembly factor BamB
MKNHRLVASLALTLGLGYLVVTLAAGCQPPGRSPGRSGSPNRTAAPVADPVAPSADPAVSPEPPLIDPAADVPIDPPASVPPAEPAPPAPPPPPPPAPAPANGGSAASAAGVGIPPLSEGDWTMWGGNGHRNNLPVTKAKIPIEWQIAFDRKTDQLIQDKSKNIKWVAQLGSQSYGNPVIADGKVFVGTNNSAGYLARYPSDVDLGCLLAFRESDGGFLWQHSSEKLPTGRVHDWPLQGICATPLVEGKRLWFVTSRGEVRCLDTEGFHDGENNGPYKDEPNENKDEADVIWVYDMMKEMGISQHNMCSCSLVALGDILFVITGNGVDESHINIPAPEAPSFFAMDKNTGEVYWTDNSPGLNILHGQWSSPAVGILGGVPQAIFSGGDGWLYSFRADKGNDGKPELLWKADCNLKDTKYILGGAGTRNEMIATPVIYDGLVYVAVGQDPEHGEGPGHLWCIDPTKRGDVSLQLAVHVSDRTRPIPHKRLQAIHPEEGEIAIDNPNSAIVWHFQKFDTDGNGKIAYEEEMHRSCGTVAIQDDLLFIADFTGIFHCLDAKTGQHYWGHDMLAAAWGSPLIVGGHVYIGDEDGDISIFRVTKEKHAPLAVISMGNAVYSTPVVANGVLFIANKDHVFAIQESAE